MRGIRAEYVSGRDPRRPRQTSGRGDRLVSRSTSWADSRTAMIVRSGMMQLLLDACPSFQPQWQAFIDEWKDEHELPLYLALGDLAHHLIAMLAAGDTARFPEIFAVVERWHVEGDAFVREAATIGLLEDLQNDGLHEGTDPTQFEQFLLPESRKWWRKLERFWSRGEIMRDNPRAVAAAGIPAGRGSGRGG
jgi:hypothetical protein